MKSVDCIGLYCPEPVFRTRKAIEEARVGEIIEVLADDPAAESDIPVLVKKLGQELVGFEKDDDGILKFTIRVVKEVR
ncbi:sulfurtransferase TusA family protein [Archaeoglobus neptunius]|uniref:sulfurtransferase TusA family protein n=1 Tax=Archaeoglobus neptunius TaxID=2798580 RepID=UPI001926755A|nr:sulfurtransferase TusA family protein [Archaeoglobus neptunius]